MKEFEDLKGKLVIVEAEKAQLAKELAEAKIIIGDFEDSVCQKPGTSTTASNMPDMRRTDSNGLRSAS